MNCEYCKKPLSSAQIIRDKAYHPDCAQKIRGEERTDNFLKNYPFLSRELARGLAREQTNFDCEKKDYIVVVVTENEEYDMHGFDSRAELREYFSATTMESSGWNPEAVYINGKQVGFEIRVEVDFEDEKS
jgi:hypothetical protein